MRIVLRVLSSPASGILRTRTLVKIGTVGDSKMEIAAQRKMSAWERWLQHPESLWARRIIFQVHLWLGMVASLYVLVMSVS